MFSRVLRPTTVSLIAAAVALVVFGVLAVRVALERRLSIDEFQYAHAAWMISEGALPYRDFFEVHFPLVYLLGSGVFAVFGDAPANAFLLRWMMLGFLAVATLAVSALGGPGGRHARLWGPVLLLAIPGFTYNQIEFRPDALATALFLASLAWTFTVARPNLRGAGAGVLAALSAFSTQKAAFYVACVYGPAVLIDLVVNRRRRPPLLGSPLAFLSAGLLTGALALAPFLAAGALDDLWRWCFQWAAAHQRHYPVRALRIEFVPALIRASPFLVAAVVGVVAVGTRLGARSGSRWNDPHLLLLAALPATLLSVLLQRAPYPYSFVPLLAVVAVFAARALALTAAPRPPGRQRFAAWEVLPALGFLLVGSSDDVLRRIESGARQREVLARLGALTTTEDAAYDNSGSYVSRPHAHFYFYTDEFLRSAHAGQLDAEVPQAILRAGAVLKVKDLREERLPEKLRGFLDTHFQPYDGDIGLWGQRYRAPEGGLVASFTAVKDARYFVDPPELLARGTLTIDDRRVMAPIFELARGEHAVRYAGPAAGFHLLWLPRDGKVWTPRRDLQPSFSAWF